MSPNGGGAPAGALAEAIDRDFGSFENFKDEFSKAGHPLRFRLGLALREQRQTWVCNSANQDNPLMPGVGCDRAPDFGLGRLGARVLPQLPKPPTRLHQRVLQRGRLDAVAAREWLSHFEGHETTRRRGGRGHRNPHASTTAKQIFERGGSAIDVVDPSPFEALPEAGDPRPA